MQHPASAAAPLIQTVHAPVPPELDWAGDTIVRDDLYTARRVATLVPKVRHLMISPYAIARALGAIAAVLVALSVAGQLVRYLTSHGSLHGLIGFVNVDEEQNLPSLFSGLLMLGASGLLWTIAMLKKRDGATWVRHWLVLASGFALMTMDEWLSFHELLVEPMQGLMAGSGAPDMFTFAWVVPGIAVVAVVGLAYTRFLLHLPRETRLTFLLAATLYLGGALGFELIGGAYAAKHGLDNLGYNLIATVEESLEMLGVIVFIYGLLRCLAASHDGMRVRFMTASEP